MRAQLSRIISVVIVCLIVLGVYYLITLPCSFVDIYYTSEKNDFNEAPTDSMAKEIDGYSFNYYIPNKLEYMNLSVLNDHISQGSFDGIDRVILIAKWTRGKLKFGKPDNKNLVVEEIVNHSTNKELSVLCDSYARLCAIACQSLDIPSRIIELNGHVVLETFIREINKWVMIDPIYGYYMSNNDGPLSVVEIIECYKNGVQLTPIVFAESISDDCLYEEKHESELSAIYLNGFTVISDQNLDLKKIITTIFTKLQLPIAKLQFVNENSILIGYVEKKLRYGILITVIIFIVTFISTIKSSNT